MWAGRVTRPRRVRRASSPGSGAAVTTTRSPRVSRRRRSVGGSGPAIVWSSEPPADTTPTGSHRRRTSSSCLRFRQRSPACSTTRRSGERRGRPQLRSDLPCGGVPARPAGRGPLGTGGEGGPASPGGTSQAEPGAVTRPIASQTGRIFTTPGPGRIPPVRIFGPARSIWIRHRRPLVRFRPTDVRNHSRPLHRCSVGAIDPGAVHSAPNQVEHQAGIGGRLGRHRDHDASRATGPGRPEELPGVPVEYAAPLLGVGTGGGHPYHRVGPANSVEPPEHRVQVVQDVTLGASERGEAPVGEPNLVASKVQPPECEVMEEISGAIAPRAERSEVHSPLELQQLARTRSSRRPRGPPIPVSGGARVSRSGIEAFRPSRSGDYRREMAPD